MLLSQVIILILPQLGLIRYIGRKLFVQIANYSPHQQYVSCGEHIALADLYLSDLNLLSGVSSFLPAFFCLSLSSLSEESPIRLEKERSASSTTIDGEQLNSDIDHEHSDTFTSPHCVRRSFSLWIRSRSLYSSSHSFSPFLCSSLGSPVPQSSLTFPHHAQNVPIFLTRSFPSYNNSSTPDGPNLSSPINSNFLFPTLVR